MFTSNVCSKKITQLWDVSVVVSLSVAMFLQSFQISPKLRKKYINVCDHVLPYKAERAGKVISKITLE